LLTPSVLKFFRRQSIPGVVISDAMLRHCEPRIGRGDHGAAFFTELAAKQLAIFRGLGFAGGYLGGVHAIESVEAILAMEASFAKDDWREFAREFQFPVENEFYYYPQHPVTGLVEENGAKSKSARGRRSYSHNVTLGYRFSKWIHDLVFKPGGRLYRWARGIYAASANAEQGPALLRVLEHASKAAIFRCKDCGDCSLPDIAFLCPESQCAKNQRNGPCGGTRDGKCEVGDFECIWGRAYDRLKYDGREAHLLDHAPVIQNESLRGTSSWANALLERDHNSQHVRGMMNALPIVCPPQAAPTAPSENVEHVQHTASDTVESASRPSRSAV
jgi:methylenetetrahydrofolate reductase (NADPH)